MGTQDRLFVRFCLMQAGASQADSNDCSTPQNSTTTSGQPRSPPFPTNSANEGVQGWLNEYVSLPAGYKTTRRDALKFASLGAAGVSLWVALTRAKVRLGAGGIPMHGPIQPSISFLKF